MDKEELGWAVLGVLRCLLLADLGQVPDVETAISSTSIKIVILGTVTQYCLSRPLGYKCHESDRRSADGKGNL